MAFIHNEHGQPIGLPVDLNLPRPRPDHRELPGQYVSLSPMSADHADGFYEVFTDPAGWTYLGEETPYANLTDARTRIEHHSAGIDPLFYTLLVEGKPLGFFSLLRINPEAASIEVGYIHFSPALQATRAATEAHYLIMRHVFDDLGYRRFEWKCDALNAPSRKAALRLGFSYEGIFRQALVYKGRNRDTAWYSILDHEWSAQKARFGRWLAPDNFTPEGRQKTRLQEV